MDGHWSSNCDNFKLDFERVIEMQLTKGENGTLCDPPLNEYFGLSYAQFITIPRLVVQSMPLEWQNKMKALLEEMDNTFDWRPKEGRYWVKLKNEKGQYCHAPLNDYRHGNIEHLRIKI